MLIEDRLGAGPMLIPFMGPETQPIVTWASEGWPVCFHAIPEVLYLQQGT